MSCTPRNLLCPPVAPQKAKAGAATGLDHHQTYLGLRDTSQKCVACVLLTDTKTHILHVLGFSKPRKITPVLQSATAEKYLHRLHS